MGARSGQKVKLLCILDILKRHTDEEHPLSAVEICDRLAQMGVTAERKAIYNDIGVLTDYGYDIIATRSPKTGYFLASRELELPEIYLLADAVRSAEFISAKKSRELIGKLDGMLSVYQAQRREKGIFMNSERKCTNEELYYLIDGISNAIEQKKKIHFSYSIRKLTENREIEADTKEMTISPYALTWQEDHYYLIGNYEKYDNLIHLRVDRMHKLEVTNEAVRPFGEVSPYKEAFDVADYTAKLFGMFGGATEKIELRCDKKIMEQVADRFGDKIFIYSVDETHFKFSVQAAVSEALVTWILNYGTSVEICSPDTLRDMVFKRAKEVLEIYSK